MDFLSETKTLEEKELLLSEIDAVKRKDLGGVRKSLLDKIESIDLNNLSDQLKSLDVVKIILAIEPTVHIVEIFDNFFKANLDKKILFDFEVDKNILGGFQIIYKGNYFDASIL